MCAQFVWHVLCRCVATTNWECEADVFGFYADTRSRIHSSLIILYLPAEFVSRQSVASRQYAASSKLVGPFAFRISV